MKNDEKAKNMTKGFLQQGLIKKSRLQELLTKAMQWKDEQYQIDKAHLDMIYKALGRLYQVRYGKEPILNTGSQTDVFLYMIEDIINEANSKK